MNMSKYCGVIIIKDTNFSGKINTIARKDLVEYFTFMKNI